MFGGGSGGGVGGGGMPHPFHMMFGHGEGGLGAGQADIDPFDVLFGQGGLGDADPRIIEQLFSEMAGMAAGVDAQQGDSRQSGPPPTSASALRSLPKIKVTPYDIAANESAECSICLEELVAGQPALRIPCGHLYHEDCVKDWLKKSNECPVCRFELPTDDAEYERGRRTRMAGRKLRMRHADLGVKTIHELRRLANFIGVDVTGCLEKSDLVERIATSEKVQIIPTSGAEATGAASSADCVGAQGQMTMTPSQLEAMSVREVKALMERAGADCSNCAEKADLVQQLLLSGRVVLTGDGEEQRGTSVGASSDVVMGDAGAGEDSNTGDLPKDISGAAAEARPSVASLAGKSVGELRQLARRLDISLDGCLEKAELVQRIAVAPSFRNGDSSS